MDLRSASEAHGFGGRHLIAALAGGALFLTVGYRLIQTASRMYYDYYFFAQVKEHYIKPDTRYRIVDTIFIAAMILVLYVAYRLLKYSFAGRVHGQPSP
jgi:hypothetical protein